MSFIKLCNKAEHTFDTLNKEVRNYTRNIIKVMVRKTQKKTL